MARTPRLFVLLTLFAAVLLAATAACGGPSPAPTSAPVAAPSVAVTQAPPAKTYEYNIVVITDYTGPGAETIKFADQGRKAMFAWWNDTVGKQLGVHLNPKYYDGRSDPGTIASLWSGALNADKPVFISGYGGADSGALQQRLPTDKVPWYSASYANGYNWLPDQWTFYVQATGAQNALGFLNWRTSTWKESRPIRFAQISAEGSASNKDQVTGVQQALSKGLFSGKVEYVGVEYVPLQLTPDVSAQVKRLIDKNPDYIQSTGVPLTTIVGAVRALQQYKSSAKLVFGSGGGIRIMADSSSMSDLEGHFESIGLAGEMETDIDAYKIFQQYKDKAGVGDAVYQANTIWGIGFAILPLRALERAIKTTGPDKVTGEAVYNAMFTGAFTSKDMLGVTGDLTYAKEAPFPLRGAKVRIGTAQGGKYVLATPEWVSVPDVTKW